MEAMMQKWVNKASKTAPVLIQVSAACVDFGLSEHSSHHSWINVTKQNYTLSQYTA